MAMAPDDETRRDGFVLVSVLAVVLVFVTVSSSMVGRSRLFILQERNRLQHTQLQATIDGVARLAALSLAQGRFQMSVTGTVATCRKGNLQLSLSVVDQDMLLDLNGAPSQMIIDVLSAIGISDADSRTLAAQIVDYRDSDDRSQPLYGAERIEYQRSGLAWGPRNDYFADPEEFAQLPGVTAALHKTLAPLITIYNGRAAIDTTILKNLGAADGNLTGALAKWSLDSRHQRFSLKVEGRIEGRAAASRLAVFSVDAREKPPNFLKWSRLSMTEDGLQQSSGDKQPATPQVCDFLQQAGEAVVL
jgi:Type II secretion system (T2SS), protein K